MDIGAIVAKDALHPLPNRQTKPALCRLLVAPSHIVHKAVQEDPGSFRRKQEAHPDGVRGLILGRCDAAWDTPVGLWLGARRAVVELMLEGRMGVNV